MQRGGGVLSALRHATRRVIVSAFLLSFASGCVFSPLRSASRAVPLIKKVIILEEREAPGRRIYSSSVFADRGRGSPAKNGFYGGRMREPTRTEKIVRRTIAILH